jgi:ribose 5-phosphate isomerase RpiB
MAKLNQRISTEATSEQEETRGVLVFEKGDGLTELTAHRHGIIAAPCEEPEV